MKNDREDMLAKIVAKLADGNELTHAESDELRSMSSHELRRVTELEESLMKEDATEANDTTATIANVQRAATLGAVVKILILTVIVAVSALWFTYAIASTFLSGAAAGGVRDTRAAAQFIGVILTAAGVGAAVARFRRRGGLPARKGLVVAVVLGVLVELAWHTAAASMRFGSAYYVSSLAAAFALAGGIGWIIGSGSLPFKRIYGTRMVSGVILGIADTLGWNASWLRIAFVPFLLVSPGRTLLVYLLLDATMEVHPEDRVHMWRFRVMRWLRARGAAAA